MSPWIRVKVSDDRLRALRDRHYSCRKPGGLTVGPPGRRLALVDELGEAGWLTHWPNADIAMHGLGDAWVCSLFRNESPRLSSELILEAELATIAEWGTPPAGGFLTFIDVPKVKAKQHPGYCYRVAGWDPVGHTKDRGLLILHKPHDQIGTVAA